MARYIDADEIKKEHKRFIGYLDEDMIWRLNFVTDKIPTADVVEVKHGHWEPWWALGFEAYKCSVCGDTKVKPLPKTEHTYGGWVITKRRWAS